MIGIKNIGVHIPQGTRDHLDGSKAYEVSREFIEGKTGISAVSRKAKDQTASDLCMEAFECLKDAEKDFLPEETDLICVCTQNGDYQLPQTSSVLHKRLDLATECASFDVSLGCSGYVYSLHIAKSFMEANNLKQGLLFTSDPYSDIIDPSDKNADLLFGDAAAVTLLNSDAVYDIGTGAFGTDGTNFAHLIKRKDEMLYMNGRGIFDFVMKNVPEFAKRCLGKNSLDYKDIDVFILHQASKFMVETLSRRMRLDPAMVPFVCRQYGNTISSSIPIVLKSYLNDERCNTVFLCGFGVGLSVAATVLRRR